MAYDVFISYASKDKIAADAVCARLEAAGIRCWIAPRDIVPGTSYGEAIIVAIHEVRVMVLVFSSNANSSGHIPKEVERAVSKGLAIIPFRIEDVAPGKSLDYFIGSVHWLDAMSPPLEKHLDNLAATVKKLLPVKPGEQGVPSLTGSGVWQGSAPPIPPPGPPAGVRAATGGASSPKSSKTMWIALGGLAAVLIVVMGVMLLRGGGNSQNATNPPGVASSAPIAASSPSPASPSASAPSSALSAPASAPAPARAPAPASASSARVENDPIVGCYMWFTNGPVVIRPNHTAMGGAFTANWKVLNAASRTYQLLWNQYPAESVTVSLNQNSVSGGDQYGARDTATRMSGSGGLTGIWNWSGLVQGLLTVRPDGTFEAGPASGPYSGTWESVGGLNYRLTASALPKDTLTLAADRSRLSGTDNFNIAISGVRTEPCAVE